MKGLVTIVFSALCGYALIMLWPQPAPEFEPLEREGSTLDYASHP